MWYDDHDEVESFDARSKSASESDAAGSDFHDVRVVATLSSDDSVRSWDVTVSVKASTHLPIAWIQLVRIPDVIADKTYSFALFYNKRPAKNRYCNNVIEHIYIAPFKISTPRSSLRWPITMMLNVSTNEYIATVRQNYLPSHLVANVDSFEKLMASTTCR